MRILTFDVETTHRKKDSGGSTASPFFGNRLVSIGYKWWGGYTTNYLCFYHQDKEPDKDAFNIFQDALKLADVVIGHNIKFDITWVRSCGFEYDGDIYDTMVAEYILAKARRWPLSLAALAGKYGGVQKEKDLVQPYLDEGKTFYEIPWEIVEEYGKADVMATENIAVAQLKAFGTTFEELYNENKFDSYSPIIAGDDRHAGPY